MPEITVTDVKAFDLPDADKGKRSGTSDPYIILKVQLPGGQIVSKARTSTTKNARDAEWADEDLSLVVRTKRSRTTKVAAHEIRLWRRTRRRRRLGLRLRISSPPSRHGPSPRAQSACRSCRTRARRRSPPLTKSRGQSRLLRPLIIITAARSRLQSSSSRSASAHRRLRRSSRSR